VKSPYPGAQIRKVARFHDDRLATEAYLLTQPAKLDRAALLGELKRGSAIPDVELSNPKCAANNRQERPRKKALR
jgi:hypothetical protein